MRQKVNRRIFRGFTLIELLIVVLIIGILAAIAVPQYQKAVLKSRFASLVPLGKALNEGNEAYYLEHGSYTENVDNLDVTTKNNQAEVTLGNEPQHQYVKLTRSDIHNNLVMYQKHSTNFPGEIHCEAVEDNTQANWLCKDSLKGTLIGNKYGYTIYALGATDINSNMQRIYTNINDVYLDGQDQCNATTGNTSKCRNVHATNGGTCNGVWDFPCQYGTFSNQSVCNGGGYMACNGSSFDGGSICNATNSYWNSCSSTTFSNQSSCIGGKIYTCDGSFSTGSVCYANASGACYSSTYDATSYCAGNFCPNGAPSSDSTKIWYRENDWPADRPSELVDK